MRGTIVARSRMGRSQRRHYALTAHMATKSTVNDNEIAHFSRLSEYWWDESGEFGMLHKLNPVRAKFVRDRISRTIEDEGHPNPGVSRSGFSGPLEGLTAVDVGCGGGLLSEARPAARVDSAQLTGTIDSRPYGSQDTCHRCIFLKCQNCVRSRFTRRLPHPSIFSRRVAAIGVQTHDVGYPGR